MNQTRAIIAKWETIQLLARDIGCNPETVRHWYNRQRISPSNWANLIIAGNRIGIKITTEELLSTLKPTDSTRAK